MRSRHAFTLIELLVAVAIISILALIALPNFLQAQTRAKVARLSSDMRTMRTAMETYRVDFGAYPETDFGQGILEAGAGALRLTTPVAYLTSITPSPFDESPMGFAPDYPQHAKINNWPLLIRATRCGAPPSMGDSVRPDLDSDFIRDRLVYLFSGDTVIANGRQYMGDWALKSVGPDGIDDRNGMDPNVVFTLLARVYDPTNGARSRGDIIAYSDDYGLAEPRE